MHDRFEMYLHLDQHSRDPFNIDANTRKVVSSMPEAERAGIVKGTIIESLNGAPYTGTAQWAAISNQGTPGELVFVGFRRPDGSSGSSLVTLVALQPHPGAPQGLGETLQQFLLFGVLPLLCMLIGYWVALTLVTMRRWFYGKRQTAHLKLCALKPMVLWLGCFLSLSIPNRACASNPGTCWSPTPMASAKP